MRRVFQVTESLKTVINATKKRKLIWKDPLFRNGKIKPD